MATQKHNQADDRLMTLAELARYLHLGQKTCLELATASKLPGILIEKQWRFRRDAIDEWLAQQSVGDVDFEQVVDGMNVPLADLVNDESVIGDLRAADSPGAIEELAARAYTNRWLTDKPWFIGAVVEREALASTAMEGGVAFLHTRARDTSKIARPFIIVGRSYKGVDFGAPDGKPTYLFFLLGLKYDKLHLPILGRLARVLRDPRSLAKLRAMPSAVKLRAMLLRMDAESLDKGKAGPIRYVEPTGDLDRKSRLRAIAKANAKREQEARKAVEIKKKIAQKEARAAARKKKAEAENKAAEAKARKEAIKKAAAKKTEAKKAPAKKAAAKKPATKKPAAKKTAAKKPAAKKTAAKKPATKKPAAKKPAAKKTAAKKTAAKKPAAKKTAAKKTAAKKPAAKKTAAKKTAAKKPAAKKTAAKKTAAKKPAAKKTAAKKPAAKKTAAKKPAAKKTAKKAAAKKKPAKKK